MKYGLIVLCISLVFLGCTQEEELPIYGNRDYVKKEVNGKTVVDTVFHKIPPFSFTNQDSLVITEALFKDKLYISDFFFTSCPTICPKVKAQMLRIYEKYADNPNVLLISHSIDTKYDTPAVLKKFADKLDIDSKRWHLVTGTKDDIYGIAKQYFIAAAEDPNSPGGYTHSGGLVLIDKRKHVRGVYDGTEPDEVTTLLKDMDRVLAKQFK